MKQCPLFDSLINKLEDNEELRNTIYAILFQGENVLYSIRNEAIANAAMYGFVKKQNSFAVIANRIFETILYEWFIETEKTRQRLSILSADEKNQFITDGHLNMELVLEKFVVHFNDLYKDSSEKFLEKDGSLVKLNPIYDHRIIKNKFPYGIRTMPAREVVRVGHVCLPMEIFLLTRDFILFIIKHTI